MTVTCRFHGELNEFLRPDRRRSEFSVPCAQNATTKHLIEALGVPHTEVEGITVNGAPAGFARRLQTGDRIEVYPHSATPLPRVPLRDWPLAETRFMCDAHLGGLARLLRMAGFDTLYRSDWQDREIADIAQRARRIVLTRDRELLKLRDITHGCYVRTLRPAQQLDEILARLDLTPRIQPFSRCLVCNAPLQGIEKSLVLQDLPPSVRAHQKHFTTCPLCHRVFWAGSHWQRMRRVLDDAIRQRQTTAGNVTKES